MIGRDKSDYSNSNKWREKYLTMLDEQEELEKRHAREIELLGRGLSRVSIAASGLDNDLDDELAQLRRLLRKEMVDSNLARVIDRMDETILSLDRNKQLRIEQMLQALMEMSIHLQHLDMGGGDKKRLRKFIKGLKKRIENEFEHSSLVDEYARIQANVLKPDEDQSKPASASSGILSSIFGGRQHEVEPQEALPSPEAIVPPPPAAAAAKPTAASTSSSAAAEDEIDSAMLELDDFQAFRSEPVEDDNEPRFSGIANDVEQILIGLLQQMEAKGSALEYVEHAEQRIQDGLDCLKLVPTLEDVSQAVLLLQGEDKKEFANYLNSLNERLQEVHGFLETANEQNQQNTEAFDLSMRNHLDELGSSVEEATDLGQLKTAVKDQLDHLLEAVDSFKENNATSQDSLSQQLEALVKRVEVMEQDSQLTRQSLEEQRQLAITDKLTGLPNREAYEERLQLEISRWQRYEHDLCMAVVDVDHFKRVNDTWGHLVGDKVLKVIAKTLQKRLRETDFLGRYGGEEFVLLLPETNREDALGIVDELRQSIADCPFHFRDEPVQITISVGVAPFIKDSDNAEYVFDKADRALYLAKQAGRNQCLSDLDLETE